MGHIGTPTPASTRKRDLLKVDLAQAPGTRQSPGRRHLQMLKIQAGKGRLGPALGRDEEKPMAGRHLRHGLQQAVEVLPTAGASLAQKPGVHCNAHLLKHHQAEFVQDVKVGQQQLQILQATLLLYEIGNL